MALSQAKVQGQCCAQVTEQNDYRIRYIGLNIEDPSLSEPGKFEAMETGNPDESTHRRDRHVRLR